MNIESEAMRHPVAQDLMKRMREHEARMVAMVAELLVEGRNVEAGPFRRFSNEKMVEEQGCLVITSHPFAVVVVDSKGMPAAAVVSDEKGRGACRPWSAAGRFVCFAASGVKGGMDMARKMSGIMNDVRYAGETGYRAEVWCVASLEVYGRSYVKSMEAAGM